MTDEELDEIEASVGFALPPEYRRVSKAFPFRPVGEDRVYWFFDEPAEVIDATLAPLADGGYDGAGWRPGLLGIGEGAAGDAYVMDTALSMLPVHVLCHETHAFEPEWPTFEDFVLEWLRAPDEYARRQRAEQAAVRARRRRPWLVVAAVLVMGLVLFLAATRLGVSK